jgi:type IV secretion system protein VirB4
VISPLGYLGKRAGELITQLNKINIPYRFSSRCIFLSKEDAKEEEERYMKTWCKGRRSMLELLKYEDPENRQCGYFTASIVIWDKDIKLVAHKAESVEETIQGMGITAIVEGYNLKDTWYGTIPGMARANFRPPMVSIENIAELLVFPVE